MKTTLALLATTLVLLSVGLILPAQNPCISSPLRVTNVKFPTAQTGQKQISWTTSSTQSIASFDYTYPGVVVFTDTRGCTQTVRN